MQTVKKRSQKQEKSVAKSFNARETIASGSKWGMKADVRNDKFLIECKTTEKSYYSLTATVWEKIEQEAIRDHLRIPLMAIDLEDKNRVIVFNPKDFGYSVVGVKDVKKSKSFRIEYSDFGSEYSDDTLFLRGFEICGKKKNLLCCMKVNDFMNTFKEVLDES